MRRRRLTATALEDAVSDRYPECIGRYITNDIELPGGDLVPPRAVAEARQLGWRKRETIWPFSTRKFASTFIGWAPGRMTVTSAM